MDDIDKEILSKLEKNSRTPFLQIADDLKVSEGTIRQRVRKLQDKGVIKSFTIDIHKKHSDIIAMEINPDKPLRQIISKLKELDINKIYTVSGKYNLICLVGDNKKNIIEQASIIEGIDSIDSFKVIDEV